MAPIVDWLEKSYGDRLVFQRVNVLSAEGQPLVQRYRVRGHPGFVILGPDGNVKWQSVGEMPREPLEGAVRSVFDQK